MFAEKITDYYRGLIEKGKRDDPLARLVYFSEKENDVKAEELTDPIGDVRCQRCANGRLIHRYADRVLLLLTDRCAAHCRFCCRRGRLSTCDSDITAAELDETLRYIAGRKEVREVILSGGDPLSLADNRLLEIMSALRTTGVRSIRLHTRYPVYDPSRCAGFGEVAAQLDAIVVHVAHRREITPEFLEAARALRTASFS